MLGRIGVVAVVAYLAAGATLTLSQDRIIFLTGGPAPPVGAVLVGGEEVTVTTDDGLVLRVWEIPTGPRSVPACRRAAVALFHGAAGDRSNLAALATVLAGRGYVVLLTDYRGYGGNPGRPTDDGMAADARAAVAHLAARPDVDPARVAYVGESLGTGVATRLATERPPAALVLRSPFTSVADAAAVRVRIYPTGLLVHEQFRTIDRIGTVRGPLLVVAGDADDIVPVEQSRAVLAAATSAGPTSLVLHHGVDHLDPQWSGPGPYADELVAFLDAHLGPTCAG